MLETIAVVLLIMWLGGWHFNFPAGASESGLIHVLLFVAVVLILVRVIRRFLP